MNTLSEIKVSYRTGKVDKEKITSSEKAYQMFIQSWNKGTIELQEEFKAIMLNRANEALGIYSLSKGGITGTVVDVRLLFAVALKCNATSILISHNHPSGALKPSEADIEITRKIKKCSDFLDIILVDHLIITKKGYYSLSDSGHI